MIPPPAEPIVPFPRRGPWSLGMGAHARAGGTRFRVWAPHPRSVQLHVDKAGAFAMTAGKDGVWETTLPGVGPGARYGYVLNGGSPRPDPLSRSQPLGVHGLSEVTAPAFRWTDGAWKGLELKDAVFYEAHVGTFTAEGTFDEAARRAAYLRELGVTMLELLPVSEFPGRRNWGYDGTHPYAPHSAYGGPAGLKRLVNACHREGLAVCLDVVYNHLGPEGNYVSEFGPYFTKRYHTPWGNALNYDGRGSDWVRRWAIENALYWITEYHVDALRLDAIDYIFDTGPQHVLQEMRAAVSEQARRLGRRAWVVAESDADNSRVVRRPEEGGWGLDAQWADDFHHGLHAYLTGERAAYYADFGGIEEIARALQHGFAFDGRYSAHRSRRHGSPAAGVPGERFVICLQNHDQVGNRPAGERLTTLAGFERHKACATLMLCAPQLPLLFMGEEWGERRPFLYFTDHGNPRLVKAVRNGRRREFRTFGWKGASPDPQDEETLRRSTLDWELRHGQPHAGMWALYRELLRLRRTRPELGGGGMDRLRVRHGDGWLAYERRGPRGGKAAVVCNLSGRPVSLGAPFPGRWRVALCTREARFGGAGYDGGFATVPPESALLLLAAR